MAIFRFLFVAVLAGFLGGSAAANWPQWRGPHLNGTSSTAKKLPTRWSPTENVVWRTKLPNAAAATPIIWNDTVFVTSAEEGFSQASGANDKLFLLALNRKDGSIRWRVQMGEGNRVQRKQNMASPSPVTDGKHVWIMTGTGWLTCFDLSGKKIWQRHIEKGLRRIRAEPRLRFVAAVARRAALHPSASRHEDGRSFVCLRSRWRDGKNYLEGGSPDGCNFRIAG